MAPDDLEQQLKAAALAKVRAETEKLAAETQALQHPAPTGRFGNFKEVLALLAGVLGTVGGSWAVRLDGH